MTNRRMTYHHGALKEALLDAGDEVLAEKGFRDFTLRECARRAGVSHAAPKYHFGDTRGLLTQLAARGFDRLTSALQQEIAGAGNLDEEYVATTRAYVRFADAWPEHFRLMFRADVIDQPDPTLHYAMGRTYTELTNVILRQRGEAEITVSELNERVKTQDLVEDILIGWSHIHGLAHLRLEQQLGMIPSGRDDEVMAATSLRLARTMRPKRR